MNRTTKTVVRTMLMLLIISVGLAAADDFEISRSTIDGGGVMFSTGADFELSGTIGQPDASSFAMAGGDFELTGGFWLGCVPGRCDCDGDVDRTDFADFEGCLTGPGGGLPEPDCGCFDLNDSGDVDLEDFAAFQQAFTGS